MSGLVSVPQGAAFLWDWLICVFRKRNFFSRFSFDTAGAEEKLTKENAVMVVSRSAERKEGVAHPPHKLLKKFDQNFESGESVRLSLSG